MAKYIVEGGAKLTGKIEISGNKNSILPCIAAALLTKEEVTLKNVPKISDVSVMLEILKYLGAEVEDLGKIVKIRTKNITNSKLPKDLSRKLRASILVVGPLLGRMNKAEFSHPGGDVIGRRTINPHITAFKQLGFKFWANDRDYTGYGAKNTKKSGQIFLEEASVTGTENIILAAVLGEGTVTIKNCAKEPHVVDLCDMLIKMGAKIEGVGSSTLTITARNSLDGAEFSIGPDFVELGTYAIAAAITGGKIETTECDLSDLDPITLPLKKMGVKIEQKKDNITEFSAQKIVPIGKLHTNIWPGFPPDLMSAFIVLATQAKGVSLMHDWMYESRMFFVDKLIGMGANIIIADPHRVLVYGPTKLSARELETPDIRAGMALVLASLIARGTSVIHKAELIERGYENVVEKINSLGGKISRVE